MIAIGSKVWVAAVGVCTLMRLSPAQPGEPPVALRDAAWDALLDRPSRWRAGDIGHSVDLLDGRTLWFFGDSIVGPLADDNSSITLGMVRGAIAWHASPSEGTPPESIEYAVPEQGHGLPVASWTHPAPGMWNGDVWYWLMGDGRMVETGGGRAFVFFASAIGPAGNPEGMWDFRRIGGAIITVENTDASPEKWIAHQAKNPLATDEPRFGEPARATENWGLAIVEWPAGEKCEKQLYVFGVRERGPEHELLVARCIPETLQTPLQWTFFDGNGWGADPKSAAGIARGLVSEFTIEPVQRNGDWQLVLIQCEPMLGRHVLARTARLPQGPWTEPKSVYEVSEPKDDARLFTYASKGHASLSRPGELLVTYALNSSDLGQVINEPQIYRPHFVRVPHGLLPDPAPATDQH